MATVVQRKEPHASAEGQREGGFNWLDFPRGAVPAPQACLHGTQRKQLRSTILAQCSTPKSVKDADEEDSNDDDRERKREEVSPKKAKHPKSKGINPLKLAAKQKQQESAEKHKNDAKLREEKEKKANEAAAADPVRQKQKVEKKAKKAAAQPIRNVSSEYKPVDFDEMDAEAQQCVTDGGVEGYEHRHNPITGEDDGMALEYKPKGVNSPIRLVKCKGKWFYCPDHTVAGNRYTYHEVMNIPT